MKNDRRVGHVTCIDGMRNVHEVTTCETSASVWGYYKNKSGRNRIQACDLNWTALGQGPVAEFCEWDDEESGSVKVGNFLTKLATIKLVVWLKVRGIVVPVPVCFVVQECRTRGVKIPHIVNLCILCMWSAAAALYLG
jgi:hypothetical protein